MTGHAPPPDPDPSRIDAELRAEQLRLYEGNVTSAVGGSLVVGVLMLVVLHGAVAPARQVIFALGLALATAARIAVHLQGRAAATALAAASDTAQRARLWRLRASIAANGLVFGIGGLLLLPPEALHLQYFIAFVLAGMAAGSLTLTAFDPVASRLFALLAMLPLSLLLLAAGSPPLRAMALMMLLFVLFVVIAGRRAWRNLRETVASQRAAKLRAEAIERSERRLQQVAAELARKSDALAITLDAMDQAILSLDSEGRVAFHNRRLLELLELPPELLARRPTMDEIACYQAEHGHYGDQYELMDDAGRSALRRWFSGERGEFPPLYHRRTRQGRTLEVKTRYLGGEAIVRTFTDVTDYIEAQQRLAASEAQARKLALVAAHTDNAVFIADAEMRIEWVNEAFTRLTGYSPVEAAGRRPAELLRCDQTDAAAAARFDGELARSRRASGELLNRAKDGHLYWVAIETQGITDAEGRLVQFVSTSRDITERRRAEAELQAAHDEAERANRAKSDFLSAMSHELRTPLNAILGFAQLLAGDPARHGDERLQTYLREVLRAGRHLLELINDVLDLARVEAGGVAMRIEPVPLQAVVDDGLRLLEPLARERRLDWPAPGTIAAGWVVEADRMRLMQVLLNLLSNAIKYNREGGRVEVAVEDDGDILCLRVSDTGPGMEPAQLARLFHAFDRLGAEHSGVQGAGIGLVLSKRLVELMHGSIGVDSEPGRGTCFWIRLPRAARPPATEPQQLSLLPDEPPSPVEHARKLLYIEDNPVNVVLMEAMLGQAQGLQLRSAPLPEVGIELARLDPPDLILLDIQLPGIDGFEVLRRLRRHRRTRAIPVLALSANAAPGDAERGLAAGFDAYLTKPVELKALLETITRLLPR